MVGIKMKTFLVESSDLYSYNKNVHALNIVSNQYKYKLRMEIHITLLYLLSQMKKFIK